VNIVEELLKLALLGSAWVLWLLIGLSVVSVGVMLERVIFFRRNARGGGETLRLELLRALNADDGPGAERVLRGSGTVEGDVVAAAFAFRDGGARAFGDALEAELSRARKNLERGMNFLGTVGNNAPFVGLLGTVIGVILAFQELSSAGARAGEMGNVMAGIAEALVATGVGLFVALPAVVAYNVLSKRVGDIEADAVALGRLVSAWLELRAQGGIMRPAAERVERPARPVAAEGR
jgi:biopolymer transport protein ExbB/TolQ